MQTVYTTNFHILRGSGSQSVVFTRARAEIERWIKNRAGARARETFEMPENDRVVLPNGVLVEANLRGDPDEIALLVFKYSHPDDRRPNIQWKTMCHLATHSGAIEFGLRLVAGERIYQVSPRYIRPGRPSIVPALISKFRCTIGGRYLSLDATPVPPNDVEGFIQEDLLSSERRLPIVLMTPESKGAGFLADPWKLADFLVGLAEVWVIENVWTTYDFTDNLPHALIVYDGGIRIYWPGLRMDDSSRYHPLYTRAWCERVITRGQNPSSAIANQIYRVSAAAHYEGEVMRRARASLLVQMTKEIDETARQAKTVPELQEKLEQVTREKDEIIRGLEEQVEDIQRNWFEYAIEYAAEHASEIMAPGAPGEPSAPEPIALHSIEEAVQKARINMADELEIWDSAVGSAKRSYSKLAQRVYQSLEIIRDVSKTYFAAMDSGDPLGEDLGSMFAARGAPKYAPKDSETTTSKYGHQRKFSQGGRSIRFERHLTLSPNSTQNCVQIYFHLDDGTKKAIVGYCGPHLDTVDWST